jgi:glycosyltransferase involved in cell wall biosynthesis
MTDKARNPLKILLISNHRRFKINFRAHPWARELAKRGHDVDVLCHADTERWHTKVQYVEGFRVIENPDMLIGVLRQGWDPYCAWRRNRFLAQENKRYDIIHCLDTRLAVVCPALSYARSRNIPVVSDWIDWWGRGGLIKERRPAWYRFFFTGFETWFEEHFRARLEGLTAISHALLERAVALGCDRERCTVIHGGADLEVFAKIPEAGESKRKLGIEPGVPVVCFSGLDVLIDLPLAVKAFETVRRSMPECVLLLVGPRPAQVRPMVSDESVMAYIKATGPVPFSQLPEYLAAADVFLMPYMNKVSNVGRWPNKVGDYMAVGRPTVSNPIGEVKWLFEHYGIGLLAEETPESMAEAALALLRDPAKANAMGREARRVAEDVFAWDKQIVKLEDWYYDILDRIAHTPASV